MFTGLYLIIIVFINVASTSTRIRSEAFGANDATTARAVTIKSYSTNAFTANGRQKEIIWSPSTTCSSATTTYTTTSNDAEAISPPSRS